MSMLRTASAVPPAAPLKVTQLRVLRSEWTKLRSLRSTVWTLVAVVVSMVGTGALYCALTVSDAQNAGGQYVEAAVGSLNGVMFAHLAIGVLGVLLASGEYGTGMIRSSLTAVPSRLPVLWGKMAVFAGVGFGVSLTACFGSFFLGQKLLSTEGLGVSIAAPGALRAVVGAAAYLTMAGLIGLLLGAILRNTAAGISVFVGVFLVLPPLVTLLPASVMGSVVSYLPSNAGGAIYGDNHLVIRSLSPGVGLVVLAGYVAVLAAVAAWRLRRADA